MTKMRWLLATMLGLALVGAGVGVGIASNAFDERTPASAPDADDQDGSGESEDADSDEPVTGTDADRAAAAAVEYTDREYATGGRVTEVEAGDDGAAFGVEVLLPDGRQVEVHVDADFSVAGHEADDD